MHLRCKVQQQQQPFNGHLSGTTRVSQYQKKHSLIDTHPGVRYNNDRSTAFDPGQPG